ncbi:DUF2312 domain-containing protein [Thioclava atlantica]|nr:GapR family DNA-binding domain-containing protein [Thioclava atlantica]
MFFGVRDFDHTFSLWCGDRPRNTFCKTGVKGYDTKVMKKLIAMRKRDKNDLAEEEAILDLYKSALGMG